MRPASIGGNSGGEAPDAQELMEVLITSSTRVAILQQLAEHGTLHRDAIRERVEGARTTVTRNLDELEKQGWVQSTGTEYQINACGNLLAEELQNFLQLVQMTKRLQDVLNWVPESELDIDLRKFRDAEIYLPKPGDPYSMINRQVCLLREADSCQGFLKVTGLHATEAAHQAIVDSGATGELVVLPEVAETLTTNQDYVRFTESMRETGRFEMLVCEHDLPYSLVLIDDVLHIVVDENGEPRALLESDSPEVLAWAREKYRTYRSRAVPVE